MSEELTPEQWLERQAAAWEEGDETIVQEFADGWVEDGDLTSFIENTALEYHRLKSRTPDKESAWDAFQYADRAWRKSIHGSEYDNNPSALREAFEQYWTEKHGGGE